MKGRWKRTRHVDGQASRHHDALTRTTVNLPDDLHHAVASVAAHNRKSLNQTVAELIRRGLAQPGGPGDAGASMQMDPVTALPTIRPPRPVCAEDVKALDDE